MRVSRAPSSILVHQKDVLQWLIASIRADIDAAPMRMRDGQVADAADADAADGTDDGDSSKSDDGNASGDMDVLRTHGVVYYNSRGDFVVKKCQVHTDVPLPQRFHVRSRKSDSARHTATETEERRNRAMTFASTGTVPPLKSLRRRVRKTRTNSSIE